jgi:hypothetical protein
VDAIVILDETGQILHLKGGHQRFARQRSDFVIPQ